MNHSILKFALPVALVLGMSSSADAASSKSSCLFFCSEKPESAAKPETSKAAAPTVETDLESAIAQAQSARKAGDFPGATKILSQLLLFAPDDGRVLGEYGKTLAAQGRSEDALAFLERAIQLMPDEWSLYSAQGVAYDQKGVYASAQTSYAHALALKPGEPTVLNNAALSHMQSGDLDTAERLLQQASLSGAGNARITQNLAMVQGLKASRPAPQPAPPAAAVESATPPAAAPAPAPAHVAAVARSAPTVIAKSVVSASLPAVLSAPPVESTPETAREDSEPASAIEALKRNPTVRMMQLPKDTPAPLKIAAPKPVVPAKLQMAENTAAPVPPSPKPVVQRAANGAYYVQAGSFNSEERASKAAEALDSLGARVTTGTVDGRAVYRVRIGPFRDMRQANEAIDQAQSMGHADLKIVSE